jgi:hypothetical protein
MLLFYVSIRFDLFLTRFQWSRWIQAAEPLQKFNRHPGSVWCMWGSPSSRNGWLHLWINKQAFMSRAHENGRFLRESPIVGLISGYVRLVKYKIIGTPSSESFEQGSSRPYFFSYFT